GGFWAPVIEVELAAARIVHVRKGKFRTDTALQIGGESFDFGSLLRESHSRMGAEVVRDEPGEDGGDGAGIRISEFPRADAIGEKGQFAAGEQSGSGKDRPQQISALMRCQA